MADESLRRSNLIRGAVAGLLAGLVVAGWYLVRDLVHLAPLTTPMALGQTILGPGGIRISAWSADGFVPKIIVAANVAAFTLLHFLVFAVLGLTAVLLFRLASWPLNPLTGALYGLTVCSATFYVVIAFVSDTEVASGVPGLASVLLVNALAGAAMGGSIQLMRKRPSRTP